ncbi:MAG: hypothetical protein AAF629_11165, partial [Chloroflexota bacterium]
ALPGASGFDRESALDMLEVHHLALTLPFPESCAIGHQFWCMLGAQESYTRVLVQGEWQGFSCSLETLQAVEPAEIKEKMVKADQRLMEVVAGVDLGAILKNGKPGYTIMQRIIEHETLHHGQLINLMFCHHLPIPESWADEWALAYND